MAFPVVTEKLQRSFERNAADKNAAFSIPEICGYLGRACRQMGKEEGANRAVCSHCSLAEYASKEGTHE